MRKADFIKAALWMLLIPALLFLSAGTLDWPAAWIFLAEYLIGGFAVMLWLARRDPGLFRERLSGAFQRGQTFWDKVFMGFIIVAWYGWLVVIGLDARRWRLSHVPTILGAVGALLIAAGFFIVWLTFRENSFAAPVIRIQDERQQRVISTGPYAIVRHPMYAGASIYMIGMPLLLGSWLGLLVLPLILGALTMRIFLEEAVLRKGLAGYDEYADRVRSRLIPGVW
jgi:protein-S-isoprenylcysteine O-methyltransferase Ste14